MGDSSGLEVVPEEVARVGQDARRIANDLLSAVNSVAGDVDGLLATWRGPAANAYAAGWLDVKEGATEVLEALRSMSELLGSTATRYAEQDYETSKTVPLLNGRF